MNRLIIYLTGALAALGLGGCDPFHESLDFERMIDQHRYDPYEPSPYFDDGMVMQRPPFGTVPRSEEMLPAPVDLGVTATGELVDTVPVPVSEALLARGENRYRIFCAPCHGVLGDADTQVAENMKLRPPRSLLDAQVRAYPAGRTYRVISMGYGLMRSYAAQLPVLDRWAVVAYVQALQLSQHAPLADLPEAVRTEARPWLQ